MKIYSLIELNFDKGNGATFKILHDGYLVHCFVEQNNEYLSKKTSPGQSFPDVLQRYAELIKQAAIINIKNNGVSNDPWGNCITTRDMEVAQTSRRESSSITSPTATNNVRKP